MLSKIADNSFPTDTSIKLRNLQIFENQLKMIEVSLSEFSGLDHLKLYLA